MSELDERTNLDPKELEVLCLDTMTVDAALQLASRANNGGLLHQRRFLTLCEKIDFENPIPKVNKASDMKSKDSRESVVSWQIDDDSDCPRISAWKARDILLDPKSEAVVFYVLDEYGDYVTVDLLDDIQRFERSLKAAIQAVIDAAYAENISPIGFEIDETYPDWGALKTDHVAAIIDEAASQYGGVFSDGYEYMAKKLCRALTKHFSQ